MRFPYNSPGPAATWSILTAVLYVSFTMRQFGKSEQFHSYLITFIIFLLVTNNQFL